MLDQPLGVPGLILAACVVMGSPGPATMSVTAVGAAFGLRRSIGYVTGVTLGTVVVLLAVAGSIASLLTSVPWLVPILQAVSNLYILYLAYRLATAPPPSGEAAAVVPSFGGGLLLGVANPKAYVAIGAVFAGSPVGFAAKTLILTGMIVAIHVGWSVAGAALSRRLQQPGNARIANRVFAAVLALTVVVGLAT